MVKKQRKPYLSEKRKQSQDNKRRRGAAFPPDKHGSWNWRKRRRN